MRVVAIPDVRARVLPSELGSFDADSWRLSGGEIHFLWNFMDGGIMVPATRTALRRTWGMCPRHAFGFLSVEAAFRSEFMHGPAVLYDDLMQRALAALRQGVVVSRPLAARRLRGSGQCLMCSMGYGPSSRGRASREVLERGADLSAIHRFARKTVASWQRWVCGRCLGTDAVSRCRSHLREDLTRGSASLAEERDRVADLASHLRRYARSFRWESRGTDTAEDRAALIGAVGWCSGWCIWLDFMASRGRSTADARSPGRDGAER